MLELDDPPELDDELLLALVDVLPLEELDPLPDEDELEDPASGSPSCATLPALEHPKAAQAKLSAAARRLVTFIEFSSALSSS